MEFDIPENKNTPISTTDSDLRRKNQDRVSMHVSNQRRLHVWFSRSHRPYVGSTCKCMPAFRESCVCVVGLLLLMINKAWSLQWQWTEGPFDTFLVGGDTAEVCDIKFSNDGKSMLLTTTNNNVYILDAYRGEKRCQFNMDPSANPTIEATFTPDGQYVLSGAGDGHIHAWNIHDEPNKVATLDSHIGVPSCLKWAPRRLVFAAAAASVLTFWIPNEDADPGAEPPAAPAQEV